MNKTTLIIAGLDIVIGIIDLIWGQLLFGIAMIVVGFLLLLMEV